MYVRAIETAAAACSLLPFPSVPPPYCTVVTHTQQTPATQTDGTIQNKNKNKVSMNIKLGSMQVNLALFPDLRHSQYKSERLATEGLTPSACARNIKFLVRES